MASPLTASLPPPVTSGPESSNVNGSTSKLARFTGIRVHWARFKHRLNSSSHSNIDDDTAESDMASFASRHRTRPERQETQQDNEDGEVDEIVVDNSFEQDAEKASIAQPSEMGTVRGTEQSDTGRGTDAASIIGRRGLWASNFFLAFLRWRAYPTLNNFFYPKFPSLETEEAYQSEVWDSTKMLSLLASSFLVVNWVLACVFVPRPLLVFDTTFILGIAPVLTLPIPVMIILQMPRRRPVLYQIVVTISVWSWPLYQVLSIQLCGFYRGGGFFSCGGKDFIGILYQWTALPVIALFALHQHRLPAALSAATFVTISGVLIIPDKPSWGKIVINLLFFHGFLLYIHYMRDQGERHLYALRTQVKDAFLKIRKAQVSERKAAESKKRLTSYIFHEVRVPLNSAMLAVQNMSAMQPIAKQLNIEFVALQGSLSVMSKVLNDILDLNRMDAGRFESISRPYNFHLAMRSMLLPLSLAAKDRGLEITSNFDENIDLIARRAMYVAQGDDEGTIANKFTVSPLEDGIVTGDEMRLRQIITNLTSNASKFTQKGGKISLSTELVSPLLPFAEGESIPSTGTHVDAKLGGPLTLSNSRLKQYNSEAGVSLPDRIVIRIEVSDTGLGISRQDLHDHRLFSPYVQTEIGKHQGGKGSGLGLALVRHIVKLSGGRLGVRSKVGVGSTFWVELPMGIGQEAAASVGETADHVLPQSESSSQNQRPTTMNCGRDNVGNIYTGPSSHSADKSIVEQQGSMQLVPIEPFTQQATDLPIHRCPYTLLPTELSGGSSAISSSEYYNSNRREPTPSVHALTAAQSSISASQVDHGQCYSYIPDQDETPGPAEPYNGSAQTHKDLKPLNVLVVDDDSMTRTLMERLLRRLGCNVSTAENGAVAFKMIIGSQASDSAGMHGPPSAGTSADSVTELGLIFLDNQMPIMSGIETVSKLRAAGRREFVVGVTGNALISDQTEFLAAGVDHVLTKPVKESSLKAMLMLAQERLKLVASTDQR